MRGTSKVVNMTEFVAASGLGGNYSGADVAQAARWTSQLRSNGGSGGGFGEGRPGSPRVQTKPKLKPLCQNHDFVISRLGHMNCCRCGFQDTMEQSQSVFSFGIGRLPGWDKWSQCINIYTTCTVHVHTGKQ